MYQVICGQLQNMPDLNSKSCQAIVSISNKGFQEVYKTTRIDYRSTLAKAGFISKIYWTSEILRLKASKRIMEHFGRIILY